MSHVVETGRVVRLYSNGDGKSSGVKFFISQGQAAAFGIKIGDLFRLGRNVAGELELVPTRVAFKAPVAATPAEPKPQLFHRRGVPS